MPDYSGQVKSFNKNFIITIRQKKLGFLCFNSDFLYFLFVINWSEAS
jgi:hypothetical protein